MVLSLLDDVLLGQSPRASTPARSAGNCATPGTRWTGGSGVAGRRVRRAGAQPAPAGARIDGQVIEMAVALKRENPARTGAQVRRILATQMGGRRASGPCNAGSPTTRRSPT